MTVEIDRRPPDLSAGSLTALLSGIIDYAGLFPPAGLSMTETVKHYARHLSGPDAWMLGRLVMPAGRLDEIEIVAAEAAVLPTASDSEPWQLSGLVAAAGDQGLHEGLERIAEFNRAHARPAAGLASIGTIELRAATPAAIEMALDMIPDDLFAFFEIDVDADPRGLVTAMAGSDAGAKVRTGGPKAEAYPAPEHLGRFMAACAAADVPFKATAGLHHPLRHHARTLQVDEYGFLNVFTAAVMAGAGERDAAALARVLVEPSIDAFRFEDDRMTFRGTAVATDAIEEARRTLAVSFGSCSFDEPLEGLRGLGLL